MGKQEREECEIKEECLGDLDLAMDIVQESDHPNKNRINSSLAIIEEFCDRWWEI